MDFFKETDVVVIGGGIIGTAILRELSKYNLRCLLVEKEPDLAIGTTKANSAVCHAGFDAPTGSWKQITNVRGNALYHEIQEDLQLDIKWTGSLVVATSEAELEQLQVLLERGQANGVPGLKLLTREEVLEKNPIWLRHKAHCGPRLRVSCGLLAVRSLLRNALYKMAPR